MSTETRTVTWTIGKAEAGRPALSTAALTVAGIPGTQRTFTVTRDGDGPVYAVSSNTGVATVSVSGTMVTVTAVSDGSASVTVTVGEGTNHFAYTGSDVQCNVGVNVSDYLLTLPAQSGALTYNGSSQTPSWNSHYDESKMELSVAGKTNAGTYSATFTPRSGYVWADTRSAAGRSVNWRIGKAAASRPALSSTTLNVSGLAGTTETFTVTRDGDGTVYASTSNASVASVSVSGAAVTVTSVADGSAAITVTVGEGTNHFAYSGTDVKCTVTVDVSSYLLTLPAQVGTLTYNTYDQAPKWNSNYDSSKMSWSGYVSAKNAGTYSSIFTPRSGYAWADNLGTESRTANWVIGKAAPSAPVLSDTALTISGATGNTQSFTVTRDGDGTIRAVSTNRFIASVTVSESTVTMKSANTGICIITVTVAEGTNYLAYTGSEATCTVTVNITPEWLKQADPLSQARYGLSSARARGYALFAGGATYRRNTVDAYDTSLIHSVPDALSQAKYLLAATNIGDDYALFAGGNTGSRTDTVDAYNCFLTKTVPSALSLAREDLAAAPSGSYYALFGGGSSGSASEVVDAYDISLTRTTPTALSVARYNLAAAPAGNYALFGGGYGGGASAIVDAYNFSLTRTTPTALSVARYSLAAAPAGNYALFGGGSSGSVLAVVDAYDTSLTRTTPTALSVARTILSAAKLGGFAVFCGGRTGAADAYDASLTRTVLDPLSVARSNGSAVSLGKYLLYGGGNDGSASSTVDVYTV